MVIPRIRFPHPQDACPQLPLFRTGQFGHNLIREAKTPLQVLQHLWSWSL